MELRPGFKRTELGVIPGDWEVCSLESISAFISKGGTPTTYGHKWQSSGVLFLRSECVSEDGLDLAQSMFISENAHASMRRSEVRDEDLLVTITGNVGRVVLLFNVGFANLNQHIARVRIISDQANNRFMYQYLNQPTVRKYYNKITTGQAYPQISLVQVRNTEVPLPSEKEQRAIADALGDVDALLAGLDRLIAKKRDLKQAAMQQLLTGQTRLPRFGGEWEMKRLGDHVDFLKHGTHSRAQLGSAGPVKNLHYGDIHGAASILLRPDSTAMPTLERVASLLIQDSQVEDFVIP
jgi:type I restriction enzyme S subunit